MSITTTKCPDGTFYGALMNADRIVISMSGPLPTRAKARAWAVAALAASTAA